jgi:hypothetical protein
MVYDSARRKVVMFGGYDPAVGGVNDTWEYDGVNWTQVTPASSPSIRYNHVMAYDSERGKVVMFGGVGVGYVNDTWEYDGVNWTQVTTASSPSARTGHAMTYDSARGKVVMFGGSPGGGETWEYDCTACATSTAYGIGCGAFYPLTLSSTDPQLGSTWQLTVMSAELSSTYAFLIGDTAFNPGISLSAQGASGCFLYTNANLATVVVPQLGWTASMSLSIPYWPPLLGYNMTVQVSAASTSTVAGFVSSNGLDAVIGY